MMSTIAVYKNQIRRMPNHREARRALATVHSRLGNHTSAIPAFRLLVKETPEDTDMLLDMALAHWRAKDWPNARAAFAQAIDMLPEKEQSLYRNFSL